MVIKQFTQRGAKILAGTIAALTLAMSNIYAAESDCATTKKTVYLAYKKFVKVKKNKKERVTVWSKTITLPAKGKFPEEAHYITTRDEFSGNGYPTTSTEKIQAHLNRSCTKYNEYKEVENKVDCKSFYNLRWQKVWTPVENGLFGQGSIGITQKDTLTVEGEMWFLTMMWDTSKNSRPERDTKWLLSANGKHVVVNVGYESGPSRKDALGGVTREVAAYLGNGEYTVAPLVDQNLEYGPITCD